MKKIGAVIVFKAGVSRQAAAKALAALAHVVELPETVIDFGPRLGLKRCKATPEEAAFSVLKEFDPDHGNPVFYIP